MLKPIRLIFAITAAVWLLLSAVSLHAQPPVKKLFVTSTGQPAAVVVYSTGADQTVEIQAAITEAADEHLPLYMPDGVVYLISDTLTIPAVYGFEMYMTGGPRKEGSISAPIDGVQGALCWADAAPDDGRPMIRSYAAHARFGLTLQGRESDGDAFPAELVGFELLQTGTVPSGKIWFDWLRINEMAVGLRCGAVGASTSSNTDLVMIDWLELEDLEDGYELNTEQSMCHDIQFMRVSECDRVFTVYAGGDIVVQHAAVLDGAGDFLHFPANSVPRPVSRGSSNAIYRVNNVKLDSNVGAGFTLVEMAEADNLDITFDGGIIPTGVGATLLFNVRGETRLQVLRYQGLGTNMFRGNASGTRTQIVVDSCQIPDGAALLEEGSSTSTTLTWRECSDNDNTNATLANGSEIDP